MQIFRHLQTPTFGRDYKAVAFSGAAVDHLYDVNELLLVIYCPIDLQMPQMCNGDPTSVELGECIILQCGPQHCIGRCADQMCCLAPLSNDAYRAGTGGNWCKKIVLLIDISKSGMHLIVVSSAQINHDVLHGHRN